MKKKIGLAVLAVVLLAAVAGSLAAKNMDGPYGWTPSQTGFGFQVNFNDGGMSGLEILSVSAEGGRLKVSYKSSEAYGTVKFSFTATLKNSWTGNVTTSSWTNTEYIRSPRDFSQWNFSLYGAEAGIQSLSISASR